VVSLNGYQYRFWKARDIVANIKTVTVKRDHIGVFYLCITLDQKETKVRAATGKSVGIDFGLKTFLNLSDEIEVEAPLYHLKNLK
jgi:putative transposase